MFVVKTMTRKVQVKLISKMKNRSEIPNLYIRNCAVGKPRLITFYCDTIIDVSLWET